MAVTSDALVWPILVSLLEGVEREIARAGLPPLTLRAIMPGAEAAFDIGCEALGYVRAVQVFPTTTFPVPEGTPLGSCVSTLAVAVEVGIMRCAPNPYELHGEIVYPSAEELTESARVQMADMAALRLAILNCPAAQDKVLAVYSPRGPQGGVVGGIWNATLGR